VNNVTSLRLERSRLHQDFEGRLGAETSHAFRQPKWTLGSLMHDGDYSAVTPVVLSDLIILSI
jgi:hypothetical protein